MISRMFAQKDIDRIFAAYHVQPVGNGYVDCIGLRKNVCTFLEKLARIGVSMRFLTTEERRLSCILVPGLWLDVPVDWRRI